MSGLVRASWLGVQGSRVVACKGLESREEPNQMPREAERS